MEIISLQNPRVKQWIQLLERNGRNKYNQYMIEGRHLVEEAIAAQAPIDTIVYRLSDFEPQDLMKRTQMMPITWLGASDAVFAKCTDTYSPQPLFAIVKKSPHHHVEQLLESSSLVVVVDGIQDPGNLGTIIRSADAVGASAVVLGPGTVDVYNPKTLRSTMGSIFHVPIIESELEILLNLAQKNDIQLVATSLNAATSCYSLNYCLPTWFIVGNEARGVSVNLISCAHESVIIPMDGHAESLNVAMATTVLLFEASRQRSLARM
jgi:TrmH family RNA methyltransferase